MKTFSSRYLLKLLLFSLLISTIPVLFLGSFSYYRSTEAVRGKVIEGNLQVLRQTQLSVEQMLKILDKSVIQIINTSYIYDELSIQDYEKVNELLRGMSILQNMELSLKDVNLINLEKDWIINYKGLTRYSEAYNRDEMQRLIQGSSGLMRWEWGSSPDNIYLVRGFQIGALKPQGYVVVTIPVSEIHNLIARQNGLNETYILNEDRLLINSKLELLGQDEELLPFVHDLAKMDKQQGDFVTKNSIVSYRTSDYTGWTYLSVVPNGGVSEQVKSIGNVTIIICILILLISIVSSLLGSKRMYLPVYELYEKIKGIARQDKEERYGDEFSVINERFNYLLNSQAQMVNQIQSQVRQLKELFVLKLVQNEIKAGDIETELDMYGFPKQYKWLMVWTLQIDTLDNTRFQESNKDLLLFAIHNMLHDLIPAGERLSPILINPTPVLVLYGDQETELQFKQHMYELAEGVLKSVKQYLQLQISIAMSRTYTQLQDTSTAYHESLEALKYRVRLGAESILNIEDIQPLFTGRTAFPKIVERELIDAIKLADKERADELLHQFLKTASDQSRSHREYQIALIRLQIELMEVSQESGEWLQSYWQGEQARFDRILELQTSEEVLVWFQDMIHTMIRQYEKQLQSQYRTISEQMVEMIHEQFHTDLTLEQCAARLNYHPNYIKNVFRKEIGVNFSDFLSNYRLEMAKKMLKETDMKISEIAEKLKYTNPQNFIRYFRKCEGVTPGQFRQHYGKSDSR
jgi:two-component system response regulator YesN